MRTNQTEKCNNDIARTCASHGHTTAATCILYHIAPLSPSPKLSQHRHILANQQIQMNTMCVCISLSAYVTLFCLFSPKISIILLHPDKNVRKLTMNSATYKRAFKPVSSVASIDGRHNLPPGGSSQPEAASGGPISSTSNVLNLGESRSNYAAINEGPRSCGCFEYQCHYIGFLECFRRLWRIVKGFRPVDCWLAIKNWIKQCCSTGDIGPTVAFELGVVGTSYETPSDSIANNDPPESTVEPDSV